MKPNWKDAPEWANYLAMDDGGQWWWYEKEPHACYYTNTFGEGGDTQMAMLPFDVNWDKTKEQRPLTTTESVLQFPYGDCGQYMEENG